MKRLGLAALVLVALCVVVVVGVRVYLSSSAAAGRVAQTLESMFNAPVKVGNASIGLVGGSEVGELSVVEPGGEEGQPFLTVEKVETDLNAWTALTGGSPRTVTLSGVNLTLRFNRDGKLVTDLPRGGSGGGTASLPRIGVRNAAVVIRQEGRPEMRVAASQAELVSEEGELRLKGNVDDPYWGKWDASARVNTENGAVTAELVTADAEVTQKKLTDIPFVPPEVWKEVQAEGRTSVHLTLRLPPGKSELGYRVDLQPRGAQVTVAAVDLPAAGVTGKIAVEDGRVELRGVTGRAYGGSLDLDGDINFAEKSTLIRLNVAGKDLQVKQAPRSWKLPVDTGRMTGKANVQITVKGGRPFVEGSGRATIHGVEFAGGTGTIELALRGDGKRLQFRSAPAAGQSRATPEAALHALLAVALYAPPVDVAGLRQASTADPSAAASRAAQAVAAGAERTAQTTARALRGAAALGRRAGDVLAKARTPVKPGEPPTYLETTLTFEDVQLDQLIQRLKVPVPVKVAGRLSFRLQVAIPVNTANDLKAYRLDGKVELPTFQIESLRFEAARAQVTYRDGVLNLQDFSGRLLGRDAAKTGSFAGKARLGVVPNGDLTFQFDTTDLPLSEFNPVLPAAARGLAGAASGRLKGLAPFANLNDPARWQAEAALTSPEVGWSGLRLRDLDVSASLDKGVLSLSKLQGKLEDAAVAGSGSLRLTGMQRFQTKLSVDGFNLTSLSRLVPAYRPPVNLAGTVRLDVAAEGPLDVAGMKASGSARAARLAIDKVRLSAASFRWALEKGNLKVDDLSARLYEGEITGSGSVPLDAKGTGRVSLALKGVEVGEAIKAVADVPVQVEGRLSGTVKATAVRGAGGAAPVVNADVDVTAPSLKVQRIPADRLTGTVRYRSGEVNYQLQADALGGKVKIEGKLPPAPKDDEDTDGRVEVRGVRLSRLWRALRLNGGLGALRGGVSFDLPFRLRGTGAPSGRGRFEIRNVRYDGALLTEALRGDLVLTPQGLLVRNTDASLAGGTLRVQFQYRLRGQSWFNVSLAGADSGRLFFFAPELGKAFQGPADVQLRGSRNGDWNGRGSVTFTHGKVFGLEVTSWRIPLTFRVSAAQNRGELTVSESTASIGHGRATLKASTSWGGGGGVRVEGNLQILQAKLGNLVSQLSSYAEGRVNARVDFGGSNVRSVNDLTASIRGSLKQVQSQQVPLLRQILPFIAPGAGGATFNSGELEGRLANGVVRLQKLELTGDFVEMIIQGAVTLQQRLDLEVTARTTNRICSNPLVLRVIARQIPAIGPVPVGLIVRITSLLSNRLVHLRVTGTADSPQIRIEPIRILSNEAARYFVNRLAGPLP